MKKIFYVLCMSALVFTGCKKHASPSAAESGETAQIVHTFCTENPETDLCKAIAGKTELTLQDVKPVMRLTITDNDDIIHGASNPSGWAKGFSNLAVNANYVLNFSVESGSIFTVGTVFDYWSFSAGTGEVFARTPSEVTDREGGVQNMQLYGDSARGQEISRIAVFDDLGKYLYLPPFHFAS